MYVYLIDYIMNRISNILVAFLFITSLNLVAQVQNANGSYFNLKGIVIATEDAADADLG